MILNLKMAINSTVQPLTFGGLTCQERTSFRNLRIDIWRTHPTVLCKVDTHQSLLPKLRLYEGTMPIM